MKHVAFGLLSVFAALAVRAQDTGTATADKAASDKAAEVNGQPILASEVDAKLGNNLAQLRQQIFTLRQKQLDSLIDQKLLEEESAKRGVAIAALVESEVTSRVTTATVADAQKFFQENSSKLQGDYDKLEEQIKTYLTAQRLQARQQEYLQSLRAAAKIDIFLARPPIFRSEVVVAGAPVRGAANAPVTIVEFSDFHCPYCRKVQPAIDELRAKYGSKIRIVYRDFPLDNLHPRARTAAEASHCAIEQGKFWEFHDQLFKNDPDSSQAALNRMAKDAGLDVPAFENCSNLHQYKTLVQTSVQEGSSLGITGTPTFFVNGRILVGAQPVDAFTKIIDEELAGGPPNETDQRAANEVSSYLTKSAGSNARENILVVIAPESVQAKIGAASEVRLRLSLKSGFHVNSNEPSDKYFIPLSVTWNRGPLDSPEVVFPAPQTEKVSFWPQPLSFFRGTFDVVTRFKTSSAAPAGSGMISGRVRYQACTDRECFAPQNVDVTVPVEIVK